MKRVGLSLIILIILWPLSIFCYQDSLDVSKPPFLNQKNQSDIDFIVENAPDTTAFLRVESLARPIINKALSQNKILNVDFKEAADIYEWAKIVFTEKDKTYDTTYFEKMIEILTRKEYPLIKREITGQVNTKRNEYWPSVYFDLSDPDNKELYFTRLRKNEDVFVSTYNEKTTSWSKGKSLGIINTSYLNEASFSLSNNGRIMVIYRSLVDEPEKSDLYLSYRLEGKWREPVILPSPINLPDSYEGGGFITKDDKYIIFSSDRAGGIGSHRPKKGNKWGNQDLYVAERIDESSWAEPMNLGSVINTSKAEVTPYLSPDGLTLFFSSSGHPGLGGTDVFKSTRSNRYDWSNWTEPLNLGKQLNTAKDDESFKVNPNATIAYFDSQNKTDGNRDIWQIKLIPSKSTPPTPGEGPPTPGEGPPTPGEGPPTPGEEPPTPGEEPPTPGEEPPPECIPLEIIEVNLFDPDGERISDVEVCIEEVTGKKIDCEKTNPDTPIFLYPQESDTSLIVTTDSTVFPVTQELDLEKCYSDVPKLNLTMAQKMSNDLPVTQKAINSLIEKVQRFKREYPDSISLDSNSVKFIWPLNSTDTTQSGYDAISVYMDHDPKPGKLLDYNCGQQTYDIPQMGYNHQGTDIFLWPFAWDMMDREIIEVVAVADGYIIDVVDGNFDRSCSIGSQTDANTVVILHKDGSFVIYAHLKKDSVIKKGFAEPVKKGERIGFVGSSGKSTGPHLHFELYDSKEMLADPFGGKCSGQSWWEDQRPYHNTKVNHLLSHITEPLLPECPQPELTYTEDNFFQGDSLFIASYYQDIEPNQNSTHEIVKPSGDKFTIWNDSVNEFYPAYPSLAAYQLPLDAEPGEWKYNVILNQIFYSQSFWVSEGERDPDEIPDPLKHEKVVLTSFDPRKHEFRDDYFCTNQNMVYFGFNKSDLNETTKTILKEVAEFLLREGYKDVKVTGYTDSTGDEKYNLMLARARANSVAYYLEGLGLRKIRSFAMGEKDLIRDEWGREIKEKSRRVEICIKKD